MKALAVLLALLIPTLAHAEPSPKYTYQVTAVKASPQRLDTVSCGAVPRMLKDRHRLVFHDGKVWVNGMRWTLDYLSAPPTEALLWFKKERAYTYVAMSVWTDDRALLGFYVLVGRTKARKFCVDQVEIVGERI